MCTFQLFKKWKSAILDFAIWLPELSEQVYSILHPTNRRLVQPVTWRNQPITAVVQLVFELLGRIPYLCFQNQILLHVCALFLLDWLYYLWMEVGVGLYQRQAPQSESSRLWVRSAARTDVDISSRRRQSIRLLSANRLQRQTTVTAYFSSSSYCCLSLSCRTYSAIEYCTLTAEQRQTTVTAYFSSKQLLLFAFELQDLFCHRVLPHWPPSKDKQQ